MLLALSASYTVLANCIMPESWSLCIWTRIRIVAAMRMWVRSDRTGSHQTVSIGQAAHQVLGVTHLELQSVIGMQALEPESLTVVDEIFEHATSLAHSQYVIHGAAHAHFLEKVQAQSRGQMEESPRTLPHFRHLRALINPRWDELYRTRCAPTLAVHDGLIRGAMHRAREVRDGISTFDAGGYYGEANAIALAHTGLEWGDSLHTTGRLVYIRGL